MSMFKYNKKHDKNAPHQIVVSKYFTITSDDTILRKFEPFNIVSYKQFEKDDHCIMYIALDSQENVNEAIKKRDSTMVDGARISVKPLSSKGWTSRPKSSPQPLVHAVTGKSIKSAGEFPKENHVICSHFPYYTPEKDIAMIFFKFHPRKVTICLNTPLPGRDMFFPYAMVCLKDRFSVRLATEELDKVNFRNHTIRVFPNDLASAAKFPTPMELLKSKLYSDQSSIDDFANDFRNCHIR